MWRHYWIPSGVLISLGVLMYLRYGERNERAMPGGVGSAEARELYLTPGGLYTEADVRANGSMTVSRKYREFHAKHDFRPGPGDRICPITRTKANPACTWIIGGRTYSFCCPPCVDEFLRLAKEHPDQVKPPDFYVRE